MKSGALVRMALGHRIPSADKRKNALKCEKTLPKRSPANGYPKDITGVETRPFFAQRSYRMAVSLKCPPIAESDPNLVWSPLPCVLLKKGVTHRVSLCLLQACCAPSGGTYMESEVSTAQHHPKDRPFGNNTQTLLLQCPFLRSPLSCCFFDPWPLPASPGTQNRHFLKGLLIKIDAF